jgi:hypothetical protein
MSYIQRTWHYIFMEPFTWLFYAFFQPARFKREYESKGIVNRMVSMLRLIFPMFLCTYPLALLVYVLHLNSSVTLNPMLINSATAPEIVQSLLAIALVSVLGIMWSCAESLTRQRTESIGWHCIVGDTPPHA